MGLGRLAAPQDAAVGLQPRREPGRAAVLQGEARAAQPAAAAAAAAEAAAAGASARGPGQAEAPAGPQEEPQPPQPPPRRLTRGEGGRGGGWLPQGLFLRPHPHFSDSHLKNCGAALLDAQ